MATGMIIEEERGTYAGRLHPHNGYYAGDFPRLADERRPVPTPARPAA